MEKDIEMMLNAFPSELHEEIKSIFEIIVLNPKTYNGGSFAVNINEEVIYIPERIYFNEVEDNLESVLSQTQRCIMDCFFTRHYNGYIRQKRIDNILNRGKIETWVIPYIVRLLGEYVVEIIEDIHKNIDLLNKEDLKKFIKDNRRFILTTEGRIASYWGEFYRFEYEKDKYTGFKIKKYLQLLRKTL